MGERKRERERVRERERKREAERESKAYFIFCIHPVILTRTSYSVLTLPSILPLCVLIHKFLLQRYCPSEKPDTDDNKESNENYKVS